jgi:Raf kinase inhibitor-like YbhB/YbcL family protein
MSLSHTLTATAFRLLRPLRAGEDHLTLHRLRPVRRQIELVSPAFALGATIPEPFAGREGRSPPLRFSPIPRSARELVLLLEDADAPLPRPFVHWVLYGLPPGATGLPEGLPPTDAPLASGARQGKNSLHSYGYTGPQPPPGHGLHHYYFQLFAVDVRLDLRAPVDRERVVHALGGHVLAQGELCGTYERR